MSHEIAELTSQRFWEVVRNRKVQIRFDRLKFDRAIVYFKGERMGAARPVDFVANDRKPSKKVES